MSFTSKSTITNNLLTHKQSLVSSDFIRGGNFIGYYNYPEWLLNFDKFQILGKVYKWMDENPIRDNIWNDNNIWKD